MCNCNPKGEGGHIDNWPSLGAERTNPLLRMESVDILVSEEAQQDMDLKSAFVPAVPSSEHSLVIPSKARGGWRTTSENIAPTG